MATLKRDGNWTATKPFPEALNEFLLEAAEDNAKLFACGTAEEVEKEKQRVSLEGRLDDIQRQVEMLKTRQDDTGIVVPTSAQVEAFGGRS